MATTGASLQPVYERMNGISEYHPLGANTFSDWSLEAGDIISLTREGNTYHSPVHTTSMTWRGGSPQISVNSTGNEKREAVEKVSKRQYARGGAGRRIAGNMFVFEANQNHLLYEVDNKEGKFSKLEVNLDGLTHEVGDLEVGYSRLSNTVSGLYHEVYEPGGSISILENTAKGFRTRLEPLVDEDGNIKAAEIATSINNAGSQVYIGANHVRIDGKSTVQQLFTGNATVGKMTVADLRVQPVSGMGAISVAGCINAGVVVGNTLKLYNMRGQEVVTFNRAITSWSVAGGGGNITVNAQPQNQSKSVPVRITGPASISSNGTRAYNIYYINDSGSDVLISGTTFNVSVDVAGSASDINLGSASYTYTRPSGTSLTSFRNAIMSAVQNRCFFRFKATLDGGSGEKWYYIDFE